MNAIAIINAIDWNSATFEEKQVFGHQLRKAGEEMGFLAVANAPLTKELQERALKQCDLFFTAVKEHQLASSLPYIAEKNRGFESVGSESLDVSSFDYKETFMMGFDEMAWPETTLLPEFKSTMDEYMDACQQTLHLLLKGFAVAFGLEENFFSSKHQEAAQSLRALHYPPSDPNANQFAVSPHTDYGTLTLLTQDELGGLSVMNPHTEEWYDSPAGTGMIGVNVGDLFGRWSGDVLARDFHRVNSVVTDHSRYSLAFFGHPDFDTPIETFTGSEAKEHYAAISSGDYLFERLAETREVAEV
ncbi:hypothetical protein L0B53_02170 [Vibrio sp. SS-MA-C1-2]|uniref:isopenicillin N synthase family dioxygenase n=1 Tax=Vibrio sp. SS-MA-C1-2 TaxID=2908646 RepID=UPI001F25E500|nr:2OG-Fe(II) oxygenase family protein [Vibrio sp. SS-MA-C1-2]UJF17596.1 hypothetical protein L0B53_02170 [Vibrio sp. SS-MA-C1-2]